MSNKFIDLTGTRFERLVAISRSPNRGKSRAARWLCHCDCGAYIDVASANLVRGATKSCGCFMRDEAKKRFITHGMWRSRTYTSWDCMIQRCTNPKYPTWRYYGGRGIKVCDRWRNSFENFLADMKERPADRSIDRIDPDSNYEPSNCRWATATEQANNKSAKAA